jgi:hypothetical protein
VDAAVRVFGVLALVDVVSDMGVPLCDERVLGS